MYTHTDKEVAFMTDRGYDQEQFMIVDKAIFNMAKKHPGYMMAAQELTDPKDIEALGAGKAILFVDWAKKNGLYQSAVEHQKQNESGQPTIFETNISNLQAGQKQVDPNEAPAPPPPPAPVQEQPPSPPKEEEIAKDIPFPDDLPDKPGEQPPQIIEARISYLTNVLGMTLKDNGLIVGNPKGRLPNPIHVTPNNYRTSTVAEWNAYLRDYNLTPEQFEHEKKLEKVPEEIKEVAKESENVSIVSPSTDIVKVETLDFTSEKTVEPEKKEEAEKPKDHYQIHKEKQAKRQSRELDLEARGFKHRKTKNDWVIKDGRKVKDQVTFGQLHDLDDKDWNELLDKYEVVNQAKEEKAVEKAKSVEEKEKPPKPLANVVTAPDNVKSTFHYFTEFANHIHAAQMAFYKLQQIEQTLGWDDKDEIQKLEEIQLIIEAS